MGGCVVDTVWFVLKYHWSTIFCVKCHIANQHGTVLYDFHQMSLQQCKMRLQYCKLSLIFISFVQKSLHVTSLSYN